MKNLQVIIFVLLLGVPQLKAQETDITGNNYGAGIRDAKNLELNKHDEQLIPETPDSFNKRMQWFDEAQYGMFIHFGLFSHHEGEFKGKRSGKYVEWLQADLNVSREEYAELKDLWNPKDFDAKKIVKLAKKAQMKYLVITTKHHEGFCLWPSKHTDFDIENSPMKGRDLIKELSDECKKQGIIFGTYYSLIDWHHPSQSPRMEKEKRWQRWGHTGMNPEKKGEYVQYMKNQIKELIVNYDSKIMWFDGDWTYWWTMEDGIDLYNYIRGLSSEIIINNRCAKRGEFKKDFGTPEQEHHSKSKNFYWEACYTMNDAWGYNKFDENWKSVDEVYDMLQDINSKGGNFLLNIGPDKNGNVPAESVQILQEVGRKIKQKQKN